jgi:hypothetical protein
MSRISNADAIAGFALAIIFFAQPLAAQPVTTLDDITYWIGAGPNRSALVIDFDDASATPASVVWGYQYSGAPSAETMFRDVVTADPRLYAKITNFSFGDSVNGVGYDADNDGFALNDATVFGPGGIFESSSSSDGAIAVDPDDLYREGFFTGFWHMGVASTSPYDGGTWLSASVGMSDQLLSDGMFIGFTLDSDFSSFDGTPFDFPANPKAALDPNAAAVPESAAWLAWSVIGIACLACSRRTVNQRRRRLSK